MDDPAVLQHKIEIGQYVIEQLQSANAAMQAVVQYGMAEGATDDGLAEAHDAVRQITDLLTRAESHYAENQGRLQVALTEAQSAPPADAELPDNPYDDASSSDSWDANAQ